MMDNYLLMVDEVGEDQYCWQIIDKSSHLTIEMGYESTAAEATKKAEETIQKMK